MGDARGGGRAEGESPPFEPGARPVQGDMAVDDLLRWLKLSASAAYTASTDDEAFQGAVDLVCAQTGWLLGHVWRTDEVTGDLVSTGIWHGADTHAHQGFVAATAGMTFPTGRGLPGRCDRVARR